MFHSITRRSFRVHAIFEISLTDEDSVKILSMVVGFDHWG